MIESLDRPIAHQGHERGVLILSDNEKQMDCSELFVLLPWPLRESHQIVELHPHHNWNNWDRTDN
jgi:hypothetical protein